MQNKKHLKIVIFTFLFLTSTGSIYSQANSTDYFLGYGGVALVASGELFFKEALTPQNPKWIEPLSFDLFFRDKLKWDNSNLDKAALVSDVILKGLLGPSVFWSPLLSDHNYGRHLLLNIQALAATAFLTNISKYAFARQRPYSYFKSIQAEADDDFLSFFSGHTSFSFAIATSMSYILEKENPHNSALIWGSAITLASLTGYLRIASDRHYMSDVLTGAIIGSMMGYVIAKNQSKRFFKRGGSKQISTTMVNFTILF
ncbi:MAG: phosphatase PAP2 family protein [Calditrichaeota bacterium]|nr:MAG: PAP2 family protein [Calditrichota bacterium]MBL1205329.1 phosphatase PAP2 family protein [Calditrichota bacterium]NOG45158.1 phosphatase PAP2 family protein [Calditrichota bacterium]